MGEPAVENNGKTTVPRTLGRVRKTLDNCEPSGVESRAIAGGDLRFGNEMISETSSDRGSESVLLFTSILCFAVLLPVFDYAARANDR